MLGVGASTRYDKLTAFTSFNNPGGGAWVEVVAPGENIVSAIPGGRYGAWSGTSMAAPIVSGIAALVKAKNPTRNADDIVSHIKEISIRIRYDDPLRNFRIDTERVDAFLAVTTPIP
jgi:subtilisin family serine protease